MDKCTICGLHNIQPEDGFDVCDNCCDMLNASEEMTDTSIEVSDDIPF